LRVIYIRVAKGLPAETQQRADIIAASGATADEMAEAWIDRQAKKQGEARFPQRGYMLGAIREGDEVWIARPGIVGAAEADILDFLRLMTEQGGVLRVASTGGSHRFSADLPAALDLVRDIRADERSAVMEKARQGIRKRVSTKTELSTEQRAAALVVWFDHSLSNVEAAAKIGLPPKTCYNLFGKRGTPAFGAALNKRRGKA
jgi:hypothetical protein